MTGLQVEERKTSYSAYRNPVKVIDQLFFVNKETATKWLILKLQGDVLELHEIQMVKFEIKQFDRQGAIIDRAVYAFKDLNIPNSQPFILPKKIPLDTACSRIEFMLIQVESTYRRWNRHWSYKEALNAKNATSLKPKVRVIYHENIVYPYLITLIVLVVFVLVIYFSFFVFNDLTSSPGSQGFDLMRFYHVGLLY